MKNKGKDYFDELLSKGLQRMLTNTHSSIQQRRDKCISKEGLATSETMKLASYLKYKRQKNKDGSVFSYDTPMSKLGLNSSLKAQQNSPSNVCNGSEDRVLNLVTFVKQHIDNEENFYKFQELLNLVLEKPTSMELLKSNSRIPPEAQEEKELGGGNMTYDLLSPQKIRKKYTVPYQRGAERWDSQGTVTKQQQNPI